MCAVFDKSVFYGRGKKSGKPFAARSKAFREWDHGVTRTRRCRRSGVGWGHARNMTETLSSRGLQGVL